MEERLHQWLQIHFDYHLCHSIPYRRNSQRPLASITLWYLHHPHGGWKITPRRHPIPEFIEVVLEILLKLLY